MKAKVKYFIFYIIFISEINFSQTYSNAYNSYRGGLYNIFNHYEFNASHQGQGFSFYSNVESKLQTNKSIYLQSSLTMFKITKEKKYLDKFIIHSKREQERKDESIILQSLNTYKKFYTYFPEKNKEIKDTVNTRKDHSKTINEIYVFPTYYVYITPYLYSKEYGKISTEYRYAKEDSKTANNFGVGIGYKRGLQIMRHRIFVGFEFNYINIKSHLRDTIKYYREGYDPADCLVQPCYQSCTECKYASKNKEIVFFFSYEYKFSIRKTLLFIGTSVGLGGMFYQYRLLNKNNSVVVKYPAFVPLSLSSGNYFILTNDIFSGIEYLVSNKVKIRLYPTLHTLFIHPYQIKLTFALLII